jgi:hypothetical protein
MTDVIKLSEYGDWLRGLKQQIKTGQIKAALSVNSQMIMLLHSIRHCGLDPQTLANKALSEERRNVA